MKFEIKNRYSRKVIFTVETKSLRLAVEAAVKSGADLSEADLSEADFSEADLYGANLFRANLYGANLYGANLYRADLYGAHLSGANLYGAHLSGANLYRANLSGANLTEADLSEANLSEANLYGANLYRAHLSGANLTEADLSEAKGINKFITTQLYFLYDQVGKIRAYKIVNSQNEGIYQGGLKYEIGKTLEARKFNCNEQVQCGAGINLATLDWCIREWREGYKILVCEFTAKDIVAIPIGSDGKFRVRKCKVIGEKDLKEIGLTKEKEVE